MADTNTPKLKLLKLPDTKPTKRTIACGPELDVDLQAYLSDRLRLLPQELFSYFSLSEGYSL